MNRKTYARLILADRAASATVTQAIRRTMTKNPGFLVLMAVCVALGCLWTFTGMAPAIGGFMFGLATGVVACWAGTIKRYVHMRPYTEEFVDWKKVEDAAKDAP